MVTPPKTQQLRMTQTMLLISFATLPILLATIVKLPIQTSPAQGATVVPILVAVAGMALAVYFILNRLGTDQEPGSFSNNMIIALAGSELISLAGIFIGVPNGLPLLPFLAGTYFVIAYVFLRLTNFWSNRSEN